MSKSSTTTKKETERYKERIRKLPPMEAIVTRNKSALFKRQLRNKEASMKKIIEMTQMLKSPTSQKSITKSPKKTQKGPPQKGKEISTKKHDTITKKPKEQKLKILKKFKKKVFIESEKEVTSNECCPNNLKRNVVIKKIMLKPRHELKLIGSKRKMAVPQRGITSPKRLKPDSPSMEELILAAEEALSDEDLLEILTCPSPVWWEEPVEEYFYKLTPPPSPGEQQESQETPVITEICETESVTEILKEAQLKIEENKNRDEKFMKKRSVLESLLGNIKNKTNNNVKVTTDGEITETKGDTMKVKAYPSEGNQINSDILSESTEDELSSLSDEKFLNELENIQIPIEAEKTESIESEDSINNSPNALMQDICVKKENDDNYKEISIDNSVNDNIMSHEKKATDINPKNKSLLDSSIFIRINDKNHEALKNSVVSNDYVPVNSKDSIENGNHGMMSIKTECEVYESNVCDERSKITSKELIATKFNETIIKDYGDKKATKTKSKESGDKVKKISPRKNKIISFEPHGLPIRNLDLELLKEKTGNKKIIKKKSLDETSNVVNDKPKSPDINKQKGKPDVMTVYKIICQDKFPLEKCDNINEEKQQGAEFEDLDTRNRSIDGVKNRMDLFYKTYKNTHRRFKSLDLANSSSEVTQSTTSVGQSCNEKDVGR